MLCPRDRSALGPVRLDHARCWSCPECGGSALTVALLRRMMPAERLHGLWAAVRAGAAGSTRCPSCDRPMRCVAVRHDARDPAVEGCLRCHVVWLGAPTLAALAPDASSPRPLIDAPVPGDASGRWEWNWLFQRLTEKEFGGPSLDLL